MEKPISHWRFGQIHSKMKEIEDEISVLLKILCAIQNHTHHMRNNLESVTCIDKYLIYFPRVNSSLLKYINLLSVISLKAELSYTEQVSDWNTFICVSSVFRPFSLAQNQCDYSNSFHFKNIEDNVSIVKSCCEKCGKMENMVDDDESSSYCDNYLPRIESLSEKSENSSLKKVKFQMTGNPSGKFCKNSYLVQPNVTDVTVNEVQPSPSLSAEIENKEEQNNETVGFQIPKHISDGVSLATDSMSGAEESTIRIVNMKISRVPNFKYKGHIQCAISPKELYIYFATNEILQMESCDEELKELRYMYKSAFHPHHNKSGESQVVHKEQAAKDIGSYALYDSESEGMFYRAKIKNWNMDDANLVSIFLIDYGVTRQASLDKIYPLPYSLTKYPAFATKCHVSNVLPTDPAGVSSPTKCDDNSLEIFRNWIEENESVTIVIDEDVSCDVNDSLAVKLYDATGKESLNELLSGSLAKHAEVVAATAEIRGGVKESATEQCQASESASPNLNWNPMEEDYESQMNSYDIDINDPAAAIYGYVGKDYRRVCKLYCDTGKCFKGTFCRKEHIKLDAKGFTTDKEEVYINSFYTIKIPNPREELHVRVTRILSATDFYCILDGALTPPDEETLLSLGNHMNTAGNVLQMKKLSIPPSIGQIVAAKSPTDNLWYRARVLEVVSEKHCCTVFFVDYGITEFVNFCSVRRIDPQYLHFPFQALLCKIAGVCSKPDISVDEVITFLNGTIGSISKVIVLSSLPGDVPRLSVKLFNSNGEDVANLLLRNNFVTKEKNILMHEDEACVPG